MTQAQQAIREAYITGRPATLKWTCDRDGNWRQVPVVLVRQGSGWVEAAVPEVVLNARRAA